MKVIDLLNKIANGEEVPNKIKYQFKIFEYDNEDSLYYRTDLVKGHDYGTKTLMNYVFQYDLNDEIEIIEEPKKMEHYDMFDYFTGYEFSGTDKDLLNHLEVNFEHINEELQQIIDYINKENRYER